MLSDEEKKAIERFKANANYCITSKETTKIILNLIEKQQKEIEELKEIYQTGYVNGCVSKVYEINKKWKDKIKAKIEEIENEDKKYKNYLKDGRENFTPEYVWARPVLQSLLEKE